MIQLSKLILKDFRNFSSFKLDFLSSFVLFVGMNGVGKTNILESITLIGRNLSLRGSDFEGMVSHGKDGFSIFAEISKHEFIDKIGVAFDLRKKKKSFELNGEVINYKRQSDVKNYFINFIFLTPQIEQLFTLGKSERRDYLDKIVSDVDLEHQSRINSYKKLLKERLLILQKYHGQKLGDKWLNIIEVQIVEYGIAIASARVEAIEFFNKAISSFSSNFPKAELKVIGEIEELVGRQSAVQLEENYQKKLRENRQSDLQSFKTSFGVHRCDFDAIFSDKKISALCASTGEQKAIMISITLARARILSSYKNQPAILIFDEVVSHLDKERRLNLFEEIANSSLQAFFTATSEDLIPKKFLKMMQLVKL